jgi:hypothetical protein
MRLVFDLQTQPHRFASPHAIRRVSDQLGANLLVLHYSRWRTGFAQI